jgi:hypothetical protein
MEREDVQDVGQGGESGPEKRPRGRPPGGKKRHPDYQQVTLFMPKAVYASARAKLRGRRREKSYRGPKDISELVGALVAAWVEKAG